MVALLQLAQTLFGTPHGDRNVEILKMRFGIGNGVSMTLQEVADTLGLTRERIRQVEARTLDVIAEIAAGIATPSLDAVLASATEQLGMPEAFVEDGLRTLLGTVPLAEALRFRQIIWPAADEEDVTSERTSVYAHGSVKVIANHPKHVRLVKDVSIAARKLSSYCGACLIPDLRQLAESSLKRPISQTDLVGIVNGLPGATWLGDGQRWFCFVEEALTPLLARAASMIAIAGVPVDFETIYGGLSREGRRSRASLAEDFSDPLPPPLIVQELLDLHPAFRRRLAVSFDLAITLDPFVDMEGVRKAMVMALDANGGIMAKADIAAILLQNGQPIPKHSLGVQLYMSPFIVRHGPAVYALRGRPLLQADIDAAVERAVDDNPLMGGLGPRQYRAVEGHEFDLLVPITDQLRLRRQIFLRKADIPPDAAGDYSMPDSHRVCLRDDDHGARLIQLGSALLKQIAEHNGSIRVILNRQTRRGRFELESG